MSNALLVIKGNRCIGWVFFKNIISNNCGIKHQTTMTKDTISCSTFIMNGERYSIFSCEENIRKSLFFEWLSVSHLYNSPVSVLDVSL